MKYYAGRCYMITIPFFPNTDRKISINLDNRANVPQIRHRYGFDGRLPFRKPLVKWRDVSSDCLPGLLPNPSAGGGDAVLLYPSRLTIEYIGGSRWSGNIRHDILLLMCFVQDPERYPHLRVSDSIISNTKVILHSDWS